MYKRIVLKLSGEALKGEGRYGIDPTTIKNISLEIKELFDSQIQTVIVCGAGNLWRGKTGEDLGMDRSQADYIGMLGTIMNALALQDALESIDVPTRVMTALQVNSVAEPFIRRRAIRHLEKNRIVIIAGGTGEPYFSTDTAAALRASELDCEAILLAKNNVKGVYDKDPNKYSDAKFYSNLTYQEILEKNLQVIDQTCCSMAKENNIKLVIFNLNEKGNILKAAKGQHIGTWVTN
jgi:uridylate kinase